MALSGSFKTNPYYSSTKGDNVYLELVWTATQSTISNSSTISWKLVGVRGPDGYVSSGGFKVIIDGETVYQKSTDYRIDLRNGTIVASGTKTIAHNADGTRSFSAYIEGAIYWYAVQHTGNGTFTLDTIPRKSSISAPDGTLGVGQNISVSRESSGFTHTITYVCGGASGTICTKDSRTTIPWTPSLDLGFQAPQGQSVTVTFTIETFNGSTSVGTNTHTVTYAIPENLKPSFAVSRQDVAYEFDVSMLVQGHSRLRFEIVNPYSSYGAWIKYYKIEFDGKTYTSQIVDSIALPKAGKFPYTISVTDSRNRTTTASGEVVVAGYAYPAVKNLKVYRSDEVGDAAASGSYLTATWDSFCVVANGKNFKNVRLGYKKTTETDYTWGFSKSEIGYGTDQHTFTFPADTKSSYDVLVEVDDMFHTVPQSAVGQSVSSLWSLLKKAGKVVGIAFGKIAEHEDLFEIGFPVRFTGGINDPNFEYVIEQGEKDGWYYRKWNSGVGECWKILEHSTTVATQWGSLYVGNATERQNYPFSFTSKPVEVVSITSGNDMGFLYPERNGHGVNGGYASARYNVCALSAITSATTYYFNFYVIGKWK